MAGMLSMLPELSFSNLVKAWVQHPAGYVQIITTLSILKHTKL